MPPPSSLGCRQCLFSLCVCLCACVYIVEAGRVSASINIRPGILLLLPLPFVSFLFSRQIAPPLLLPCDSISLRDFPLFTSRFVVSILKSEQKNGLNYGIIYLASKRSKNCWRASMCLAWPLSLAHTWDTRSSLTLTFPSLASPLITDPRINGCYVIPSFILCKSSTAIFLMRFCLFISCMSILITQSPLSTFLTIVER